MRFVGRQRCFQSVLQLLGVSRAGAGGRLVGDVDYQQVRPKARAITPVPNGVRAMTIALLFSNTVWAAKRQVGLE